MAKLIPIYTWNKSVLTLSKRSDRLSKKPWFQGVLLLACVVVAMLLANLPFTKVLYHEILETRIQLHLMSADGALDVLFLRTKSLQGAT